VIVSAPIKTIFLGNRRIAWEVLKILTSPKFISHFEISALVSDPAILKAYATLPGVVASKNPITIVNDSRQTAAIEQAIERKNIELILSIQHNWVLPARILESVNYRAFNFHNGKLPDYKGYNSISHAILNGDTIYHPTVHWMSDEADCGELAFTGDFLIEPWDTAYSLYERSVENSIGLLDQLLTHLSEKIPIPRRPIDGVNGVFYPRNSIERILDVTDIRDEELLRKVIRAAFFPPYNIAYTRVGDVRCYLIPERSINSIDIHFPKINLPRFC